MERNLNNRIKPNVVFVTLFLIGILTYFSSFSNQFVWDDDHFFYQNIFTQSLSHIKEIFTSNTTAGAGATSNYYRPLTTFSFALDHEFWGWNPWGLHLTNTFFHIANSILLYLVLSKLGLGKIKSFAISIIFLVHPIQTEAVTYLSSRGDVLYTFFLLISVYSFIIALYSPPKRWLLILSFLLFPLSILAKEGALTTVPLYAGVLLIFGINKKLSFQKLHQQYRSHFIILLLLFWIALIYFLARLTILNFNNSLNYSGQEYSPYAQNVFIRLYTFLKTIIIYIRLLVIPYPLYLERSTSIVTSFFNPWVIASLVLIIFTVIIGLIEYHKKHTLWIFFGLMIIFANLLSVSGIIPQTALIRENWLYMPMIGFYLIFFTIITLFYSKLIKQHSHQAALGFILICTIYIFMTINQNYNWRSRIAYFEHNLRFTETARLHLNLGNAYESQKNYDQALFHLQKAVRLSDAYPQTHYNIGNIYLHQGKTEEAEKEFLKSLSLDPGFLYSYSPLIKIYEDKKKFPQALVYLKRLNIIYPDDLSLTLLYAQDLYLSQNYKEADIQFQKAITLSHSDPKLLKAIEETKKRLLTND